MLLKVDLKVCKIWKELKEMVVMNNALLMGHIIKTKRISQILHIHRYLVKS